MTDTQDDKPFEFEIIEVVTLSGFYNGKIISKGA